MSKETAVKRNKQDVTLSSGRANKLKEMSIDDIDFCQDISQIVYSDDGEVAGIKGMSKSRTAWIRRGILEGDFKNLELNGKGHLADSCIKELSEDEKNELVGLIQRYQTLGE